MSTSNNEKRPVIPAAVVAAMMTLNEFVSGYITDWRKHEEDSYLDHIEEALNTVQDYFDDHIERCPGCDIRRAEGQGARYDIPDGQGGTISAWYCSWQHYRRDMESAGHHFDDDPEEMEDPS